MIDQITLEGPYDTSARKDSWLRDRNLGAEGHGLKISFRKGRVRFHGSLATLYHGNNLVTLEPPDIPWVIESLASNLGAKSEDLQVRALTCAATFWTIQPLEHCFPGICCNWFCFGSEHMTYPRGDRLMFFRDYRPKPENYLEEAYGTYVKKFTTPKNLTRYEVHFIRRLPEQLGLAELTARDLCRPDVLAKIEEIWKSDFFKLTHKAFCFLDFELRRVRDLSLLIDPDGWAY